VDLVPNAFGIAGSNSRPSHYAYLKISEGCNHRCTFCIIPSMRGDLVSRPIGDVLNEARALFRRRCERAAGDQSGHFGLRRRRAYRTGFWDGKPIKTRMLELVEGPRRHRRALWRLGAPALCVSVSQRGRNHSLDGDWQGAAVSGCAVPAQPPDVLKRMKRPASGERNLERIRRWREASPDMVIRSTFIAGFPGETEAEFGHLLDFMREARIDRAGCFAYSPVDGAEANDIDDAAGRAARRAPRAVHGRG
jgi:ribosomal protein S12 methylthiotransferase